MWHASAGASRPILGRFSAVIDSQYQQVNIPTLQPLPESIRHSHPGEGDYQCLDGCESKTQQTIVLILEIAALGCLPLLCASRLRKMSWFPFQWGDDELRVQQVMAGARREGQRGRESSTCGSEILSVVCLHKYMMTSHHIDETRVLSARTEASLNIYRGLYHGRENFAGVGLVWHQWWRSLAKIS